MIPVLVPIIPLIVSGSSGHTYDTLLGSISTLGLTSGLKLCLDAGDAASYPGSGQTWFDTSGAHFDVYRGSTSASQNSDPTFHGTPGNQSSSEYFQTDGGDYLSPVSTPTWIQGCHKNNAKFSFAGWVYFASFSGAPGMCIFGNGVSVSPTYGFAFIADDSHKLGFNAWKGSSTAVDVTSTASIPSGQWVFIAVSVDEAAGTGFLQINGTQEAKSMTYSSPTANDANHPLLLMSGGDNEFPLASGCRLGGWLGWDQVALTTTQMLAIYNASRGRYGI